MAYLRYLAIALSAATLAVPGTAFTKKDLKTELDLLAFQAPELRVVETPVAAEQLRGELAAIAAMDRFRSEHGASWTFTVDARRGVPTLLGGGALPLLPGVSSRLPWDGVAGCAGNHCIPVEHAEVAARAFLTRWSEIFGVADADLVLDPDGSGPFGASTYLVRFQWHVGGVPVEEGSVYLRFSGGNLIQVATQNISRAALDRRPVLDHEVAREMLDAYLGELRRADDEWFDKGSLRIVPVTPRGQDPDDFKGPVGSGLSYRLVWRFLFQRPGVIGTWESLVDAHSGELLRFVDANRYGRVHGGAYPRDGHTGEADRPFAFVGLGGGLYADGGGLFDGDSATATLQGRFTRVTDACGPVSASTTDGDIDFLLGPGMDCDVPPGNIAGAGNTHAARTQYYHLTAINMKARTFMPTNSWLNNNYMAVTTNQSPLCNASSGFGGLNFYRAASGCWNLGELPGVSLHEWGHSMDDHDGSGGDSPPLETRADWTAILSTHDSCVGDGFSLTGNCGGYGDPCLDCGGVRDADYTRHESQTPWTPANHGTVWSCGDGSYFGPCGLEDHCEAGPSTQALWEFVNSDLSAAGIDIETAWVLADRLFYTAMPTMGDLYTCTLPSSNGCNGQSLYTTMMALDDDGDGTANGTPHAAAIYAALARHNIACGQASDPANQSSSSCPALTAPVATTEAGSNSAKISWAAVPNATRYLVFRTDIDCGAGFTKVGETTGTELVDTGVVNDLQYFYRVQAATGHDACVSPVSECAAVTPQPCEGTIDLARDLVSCDDSLQVSLLDSDLAGTASHTVTVWSDTEPTPEVIILAAESAGAAVFHGVLLTSGSAVAGDGVLGVAHGDTVTVRYHDASYCATGPVDIDAVAQADCQPPVISGVAALNVSGMGAEIVWSTDEPADSGVVWDTAAPPAAASAADPGLTTDHSLQLNGLAECTGYLFSVSSTDGAANTTTATNAGAWYRFATGYNTIPSYTATDTPVSIPDNNSSGATSTVTVPDDKTVLDIDVTVSITHTWDGDLELLLIGPDGTQVQLANRRGSSGNDYTGTTFDDEAATAISAGSPPFAGSFQPEQPLSAFDGMSGAGDWTFKVVDRAGADLGTIDSFTLTLTFPSEPCEGPDLIFVDGFEDGDNGAWSGAMP